MITENEMYWLTRMDGIVHGELILAVVFFSFVLILVLIGSLLRDRDHYDYKAQDRVPIPGSVESGLFWQRIGGLCLIPSLVFFLASVFTPTTKELAVIKVVPLIVNDEDVRGIGKDLLGLSKEWIEELRPVQDKDISP